MSRFKTYKLLTLVFISFYSVVGVGQNTIELDGNSEAGKQAIANQSAEAAKAACKSAKDELKDANKDYQKLCSQVRSPDGSKPSCYKAAQACQKALASSDSGGTGADMMAVVGAQMGYEVPTMGDVGKTCVTPIGSDYNRAKKDLNDQIRQLEKDKKANDEKIADEEEDFDDANDEAKEKIAEAKKDLDEKKFDIKKEIRDLALTNVANQEDFSKKISELDKEMEKNRNELSLIETDKAAALAEIQERRAECIDKVREKIASRQKPRSVVGGVGAGASGRSYKAEMQSQLDGCSTSAQTASVGIAKKVSNKIASLNTAIADVEKRRGEANTAFEAQKKSIEEEGKALVEKGVAAEQDLQILSTKETQKIQDHYTRMQKNIMRLKQENVNLSMKIANLRIQLNNTSVADSPSTNEDAINTSNPADNVGTQGLEVMNALQAAADACPALEKDGYLKQLQQFKSREGIK